MIRQGKYRNTPVRYSIKGKGRVVVLLHGFLENLELFEELSSRLSKSFKVICIDLPGHGGTPVMGYVHPMDLMADCVKAVLDGLQLRRYVLVGHSMGGYVALAFAKKYSDHLAGLGLFHSTAMPDTEERMKDRDRMVQVVRKDHQGFASGLIPKLFASENIKLLQKEVEQAKQVALKTSPEGMIAALKGMKERSSYELTLKNFTSPVLFIIGKQDTLLAWDNLLLLTSLPGKSFQLVLDHAGHMGFFEAPEKTFKTIRKFCYLCFRN